MIKAILWDNDGVLVDTEELFFQATRKAAAREGIVLTPAQFREVSLTAGRSMFDIVLEQGVSEERVRELQQERNRIYRTTLLAGVPVLAGVRETLAELGAHYRMAVVTTALREHFEAAHSTTGLTGHFEFALTREDYPDSKPAPDSYLAALGRLSLGPDDCIAIEDSRRGLAAALAAGIRCIIVPTAMTRGADFSGAAAVLAGASVIPAAVREL